MMLTDLGAACRAAGLNVVETPGWQTRGHGGMTAVNTVVCHHTAGPKTGEIPSLGVVTNGRSDLPGPLCNLALGRSGTVYVVAAGLAYHAGVVLNNNESNGHAIGIEAEATGVDAWTPVQYQAYARLCAGLARWYRLPLSAIMGHKEVCSPRGRKIDPNFDMPAFRNTVAGYMNNPNSVNSPAIVAETRKETDPMMQVNIPVREDGTFRVAIPVEAGASSPGAGIGAAWVRFVAAWGDVHFDVYVLDGNGSVMGPNAEKHVDLVNNHTDYLDIPSGAAMATLEGHVLEDGAVPGAVILTRLAA